MSELRDTRNPPVTEQRNEALERGLAQLRKATEIAVGYQPQLVTRAEAAAVLDHIERLRGVLGEIVDPTYVGSYDDGEVVEIYRKWARHTLEANRG